MKVKNADIFAAKEPLEKLAELKFPVKVSYALAKLANKLNTEWAPIDETRQGLIRKYGEEQDGRIQVTPDNWDTFMGEFEELLSQETEMVVEKVKLPADGVEVEAKILMALEPFIEVE